MDLPVYNPAPEAAAELPAYTGRRSTSTPAVHQQPPAEYVFELRNKSTPWATLNIKGCAGYTGELPTFFEGKNITGSVGLNLENGENIHSIVASVKGQIITSADPSGCHEFLDSSQTLWSKSMGDPRQSAAHPPPDKFSGKLCGTYSWSFSFHLPSQVTVSKLRGSVPESYRLPQTFLERLTKASVRYDLVVCISRGKLRSSSQLQTSLIYIPTTRPDPPSLLRQLAYQENTPLLGPEVDPEGWKSVPFHIRGTIFNTRRVEADCTLSLAAPLSYTRGTAIPCILVIKTSDDQAMDLLSSPRSIDMRLRRCVSYREPAGFAIGWCEDIEDVSAAVWWTSREGRYADHGQRKLDGEIHLLKNLKPTSAMAHFAVDYAVVVMPFEPAAFVSADTDILVRERVEVATMYASGPRPRMYSPPGYEPSSRSSRRSATTFYSTALQP